MGSNAISNLEGFCYRFRRCTHNANTPANSFRIFGVFEILSNTTLTFRHGVLNHQILDCLLNRLFRSWSKKTSKFRVTDFCEGNSPVTGEFPAQRASNVIMNV